MDTQLVNLLDSIKPLNGHAMHQARLRQDSLAKPPKSLGKLEDISVRLAGISGKVMNQVDKRRILIFASDNGVVSEGVASAPQSVTLAQTINFTRGLTGVAVLAKHFHVELAVTDMGINADFTCPGVLNRKIAHGTKNIAHEPAMTREQALKALLTGVEIVKKAKDDHVQILGIGEMGIGNTTTSSAVLCALTGLTADQAVSRGGGVNDAGYDRKKEIITQAIATFQPDASDPIDVLAKVGGFDLAAMTGAFLGAAAFSLPVVIDGFISAVAALCAFRLAPLAREYFFSSHASCELGYMRTMEEMGMQPMLLMDMRLGEGSGCPLAFMLIEAACAVIQDMATFDEARIDDGYLDEIRANERFMKG